MALLPEVCVAVGSSGLDPSGGFRLPDVDSLDVAARDLTSHSADFQAGMARSAQLWAGLGSSYSSEEASAVLAAFGKVTPTVERVSRDASSTSAALTAFSVSCRDLKQRLEAYGRQVHVLDADIDAFPTSVEKIIMVRGEQVISHEQQHWSGDADLTGRRNALASDVQAIENDYHTAQNTCAAALARVSGGHAHTSETAPQTDRSSGNWVDDWMWDAGTFMGLDHGGEQQPWGTQTVPYRPNGFLGTLQGFGAGAVELVDGLWSLTGTSNATKRDQAWGGVNTLVGAAGMLATVPFTWALSGVNNQWENDKPQIQQALDTFGAMGPAFIHMDEAGTNPNWAVGAASFNVVSTVFTGGAGAGVKAGSLASKAGLTAEKLSIATMDSARLGKVSGLLGSSAQGLYKTGTVLSKPGSLVLKVSDIVMPQTTAKALDALTGFKVNSWMAVSKAPGAVWEHAVVRPLEGASTLLRATDQAFPRVAVSPGGAVGLGHGSMGRMADGLDSAAAKVRTDHVPVAAKLQMIAPVEYFPKPGHIEQTIVFRHGEANFPVSKRDHFADRGGLKPNTEYVIEHRTKMHQVTGSAVDSIEKYYTDAAGKVVRVDTFAGVRGAWSPELNKPVANVTYNVVAKVDGGLENTFTYTTDASGHAQGVSGRVTSTLAGDMNRNAWQQLLAGKRVGGLGYEGGHSAPSFLGAPGERIGLFAQHQFQNRGAGAPNVSDGAAFYKEEAKIMDEVKRRLEAGRPVDLNWSMDTPSGAKPGLPESFKLSYAFDGDDFVDVPFSNVPMKRG
ncbi:hypothetical protein V3C33_01745 [Micrococcaceae bacterium Sec5.7]